MIKEQKIIVPKLTNATVGPVLLNSFDIDHIDLITMMFQTGYLTIKEVEKGGKLISYHLDFPNLEVACAFNNTLLSLFTTLPDSSQMQITLLSHLKD